MFKKILLVTLLLGIVVLPFLFKDPQIELSSTHSENNTLVILSPHNPALRYEFTQGFQKWYENHFNERVYLDWRIPGGGTRDAVRYVDAVYLNNFKLYWEKNLGQPWSSRIELAFNQRGSYGDLEALKNIDKKLIQEVDEVFKNSDVSCGIDVFFGGGKPDVEIQAAKNQFEPLTIFQKYPEWFGPEAIPQNLSGNAIWDSNHFWVGTALSTFGIIYNQDNLDAKHFTKPLDSWEDLAAPEFIGEVALTDPTISGTFTQAFEIILQLSMQKTFKQNPSLSALEEGWIDGLRLIQKISANSRYFSDAATKPVLDVSTGNCALGLAIDFYGFFQEENLLSRSGSTRFGFVIPKEGTMISTDPIAIFKGAPHPHLANAFVEYMLSIEGQKLWNYNVGAPGGPQKYSLSRSPIRKEFYTDEHKVYSRTPEIDIYQEAKNFTYHPEWTMHLSKELRFAIKVAFVEVHSELVKTWEAIIKARKRGQMRASEQALKIMQDLGTLSYQSVNGPIQEILNSGDHLKIIQLETEYIRHFRNQYERALRTLRGE